MRLEDGGPVLVLALVGVDLRQVDLRQLGEPADDLISGELVVPRDRQVALGCDGALDLALGLGDARNLASLARGRLAFVVAVRAVPFAASPASRTVSAAPVLVTSKDGLPLISARTTASVSLGISRRMRSSIFSSSARIDAANWAVSSSPTAAARR